jgi:hypothetical protein
MLALYLSDPNSPLLDADTSTADLYRQLLQNFIRREVVRNENRALRVEEAVREQFWRLSVAAFAMFNRGHQNVTDVELGMDLLALESSRESVSASPAELGQELIGQFFFVHTAEAQVPGSQGTRRSYEFMHATFSEYLIAMQTVELLTELAGTAFAGHRGLPEVNDDLLFALLSHQPLPVRRAIIHFVYELVSEFEVDKRERISQLLDMLIGGYRYRRSSDLYTTYRPLAIDRVRQLAAYSANLITLRVLLVSQDGPVPVAELWPEQDQALDLWRSTVTLWWSGLDAAGWQSMLATLDVVDGVVRLVSDDEIIGGAVEARYARLIGDSDMGLRSRYGSALHDDVQYFNYGDAWSQVNVSGIVPQVAMRAAQPLGFILTQPSDDVDEREVREVLNMLAMFLKMRSRLVPHRVLKVIIEWTLNLPRSPRLDPYALAAAVTASPRLVDDIPQLADPVLYGDAPGIALLFELADNDSDDVPESFVQLRHEIRTLYPETVITEDVSTEVANLLQAHRWAQSGIMDHLRIATIDGTIVIGVGAIRLPAGRKVSVVEFSGDPMDDENGRVVYSSDDNIAELK